MRPISCNLCGQNNYRIIYYGRDRLLRTDERKFAVVRCRNCGLVYLNPQPGPDELSKYYPETYGPFIKKEMFKYSPLAKILRVALGKIKQDKLKTSEREETKPWDDRSINYLDFGCGGGAHLESVREAHPNWNLYGLDNSEIACKAVEQKGFKVFCGDIADVSLPENYFDHIHMGSVVEHVSDPKYVMSRLNRSLRTGGTVLIRTPNFASLARVLFGKFWQALDTPRHLFLFTKKTLERLLVGTGFKVKKVSFKVGPSVEIKSFYYLLNKKDRRMSPITWRLLRPFTDLLARLGWASTIIITAKKIREA